jgi:mRNA interferase HicA
MCDTLGMTGNELLRRLRRLARRQGATFLYEGRPGKGGHGRSYLGDRFTTIPALTHVFPRGLLSMILRDLGLSRRDLSCGEH